MSATFCRPFARQPDATRRVIGHGTTNDVSSPHGGRLAIERSAGGRDACTEAGREWEEGLDKGNGRSGWHLAVSDLSGFMAPQYWRIRFAVETYRHRRAGRDRQDRGTKAGAGAAGPYARGGRDERSGESKGM